MDSANQPAVSRPSQRLCQARWSHRRCVCAAARSRPTGSSSGGPRSAALPQDQAAAPTAQSIPPQQRRIVTSFGSDLVSSMQSLMGTIVIAIFVITFVVQAFQIPSESMENTLLVGDYLLVNKLCYGRHWLGRSLHAVSEDRARRHHRVSLSGGSEAAFREARDWPARRPAADGEQEGLHQRKAAR